MNEIGSVNSAAGYRLVRRLGSGRRADVFLGHSSLGNSCRGDASTGNVASPSGGGVTERAPTAAIKLFRPGIGRSGIDAEIGALARTSSPHLVRLYDLATAQDGLPVLVLGLLRPQSLARLLASRSRIESGEAVTILAPLAAAVAELHRVGVAHGGVTAGSVLFDELGTPVLASFGRALIIGEEPEGALASSLSPAQLAASAPALRDLAALAALAGTVLESTPDSAGRRLALSFIRSADPSLAPERFAAEIANVLFDSAPATPVVLDVAPRAASRSRGPSRALTATVIAPPIPAVRGRRRARPPWLDAMHLPEWLEQVVRSSVTSGTTRSGNARALASAHTSVLAPAHSSMLAAVRRRVWVAAASVAVLLIAALALVPDGDASSGRPYELPARPTPTELAASDEPEPPPSGGPARSAPEQSVIAGDDPVQAALALLELRDGCLALLSVLCLDTVDQVGSAAWEADGYLIRQAQESGGAAARPSPPAGAWEGRSTNLVERIGNSALINVASPEGAAGEVPVSVLLIKGVEGWRIRDLFIG